MLRKAYLTWEFWIPPLFAVVAVTSMVYLLNHNQDLLRQNQIDKASKIQVEQVNTQIQSLTSEIHELRTKVQANSKDMAEVKKEIAK